MQPMAAQPARTLAAQSLMNASSLSPLNAPASSPTGLPASNMITVGSMLTRVPCIMSHARNIGHASSFALKMLTASFACAARGERSGVTGGARHGAVAVWWPRLRSRTQDGLDEFARPAPVCREINQDHT